LFRYNRIVIAIVALGLIASVTHAEEGGSGHYTPGSVSSFIDGVTAEPTFIVRFS
jgi:hypothetical protein